jgi:hypothetical protein
MKRLMTLLLALLIFLAGCGWGAGPSPAGDSPQTLYVLASGLADPGAGTLAVADATDWTVERKTALPLSWATELSRDSQGRLWVGFAGTADSLDDRVQIYTPAGELAQELRPCITPRAGITFAANRAFIACAERGFYGSVAVVSLDTLELEAKIELRIPNSDAPLIQIASAANEDAVVVAGLTTGPEETSYTVLSVIDPHSLTLERQIPLGEHTDIWQIIPYEGRFYLLNAASWRQVGDPASDILILDLVSEPLLQPVAIAASPVWGTIAGGALYAYHDPTWNQPNSDPHRTLSRLDLRSGEAKTWDLPDEWRASDLAVLDGAVLLAHGAGDGGPSGGIYRFDPADGTLDMLLEVADASRMVVADEQQGVALSSSR